MGIRGNWSEAMDAKLHELQNDPQAYYKRLRRTYVQDGATGRDPLFPGLRRVGTHSTRRNTSR